MIYGMGDRCAICGSPHRLDVHHIVSRGMGGSSRPEIEAPENKITICRSCHTEITEHRWDLVRDSSHLAVVSVATGEIIARRYYRADFDASSLFANANTIEGGIEELIQGIPYLTDEQLVELFGQLRGIDKRSWKVQAAILWEAKQRSVYGDRAWEAMGRSFGIGWRQAYNLARVWETFFAGEEGQFCNRLQNSPLEESTWYVVASETESPELWLGYAEDQKSQDPGYSIADFRDEIRLARSVTGSDSQIAPLSEGGCRLLRVYCEKLGRIARPGECPGCETIPQVGRS